MTQTAKMWVLNRRPVGDLQKDDLVLQDRDLPPVQDGEVKVRTIYLSVDPTNRVWMKEEASYLPPVQIGDAMRGISLCVIEESRASELQPGQYVMTGACGWATHNVLPASEVNALPMIPGLPLAAWMGPLGPTGMTAYFGLLDIGQPKAGETLVVSAAAGAVGSIVGQIGKLKGCHVVGIAGSDEKCRWLTEEAGFDAALNYKQPNLDARLAAACPNGIDINFENVGGEIMDIIIGQLNDFARMPLCGMISTYNQEGAVSGPTNFSALLMRRVCLKGFIVMDYTDRFEDAVPEMMQWISEGKIKYQTDIVDGFETAPSALDRIFTGQKMGKLLVRCSDDSI